MRSQSVKDSFIETQLKTVSLRLYSRSNRKKKIIKNNIKICRTVKNHQVYQHISKRSP